MNQPCFPHLAALVVAALVHAAQAAQAAPPTTAGEAARQVCQGQVTSVALVTDALARAKAVAALNAFITLDETGALAHARDVDQAHRAHPKACAPLRLAVETQLGRPPAPVR